MFTTIVFVVMNETVVFKKNKKQNIFFCRKLGLTSNKVTNDDSLLSMHSKNSLVCLMNFIKLRIFHSISLGPQYSTNLN